MAHSQATRDRIAAAIRRHYATRTPEQAEAHRASQSAAHVGQSTAGRGIREGVLRYWRTPEAEPHRQRFAEAVRQPRRRAPATS